MIEKTSPQSSLRNNPKVNYRNWLGVIILILDFVAV